MMLVNGTIIPHKSNYLSRLAAEVKQFYDDKLFDRQDRFRHFDINQEKVMQRGYPMSYHIINE